MSMSKVKFGVKKVRRVLSMKDNNYEPAMYEVWKVSGPRGFKKYFTTKKDATAYIKSMNDRTMTAEVVSNLLREIKMK